MIKKLIRKIDWWIDYYFVWMLYNNNKSHQYIEYMENKWLNPNYKKKSFKPQLFVLYLILGIILILYFSCKNQKIQKENNQSKIDTSVFDSNQLKYYIFDHSEIPNYDTTK